MSDLTLALTGLTGGTTGTLDGIDGADVVDGDAAVVVLATGVYHYKLVGASGASESSPNIIAPDANPGTKRWILQNPVFNYSHVFAQSDAGTQNFTTGTTTTIIFEDEIRDTLGEYNPATGIFTATYAGYYHVDSVCLFDTVAGWEVGEIVVMELAVEGTKVFDGIRNVIQPATFTGYFGASVSGTVYLAAGEELDVGAYQNNDATLNLRANATNNWVTIDRMP